MSKVVYFKCLLLVIISADVDSIIVDRKPAPAPASPASPALPVSPPAPITSKFKINYPPFMINAPVPFSRHDYQDRRPLVGVPMPQSSNERRIFSIAPKGMQLRRHMWPGVDETVNIIVHKAAEKAHAIKNIFQQGVQKKLGFFNAAVAFKKAKFQKALQSAAQLKQLATAKIKTIAATKLNHLQQIAALKAQKLQTAAAVAGAAANAANPKPKPPQQDNSLRIPRPILLSQQTLPSKTISGDYVHTYDNSFRAHFGKGKRNNYADMGVTSFEHFQDTVLRELEEKEERKVEATLHTLYENEPIIRIASHHHHDQSYSEHPSFPSETKIHGSPTPIPVIDGGWVPMGGIGDDPKFPADGQTNPIFFDQNNPIFADQTAPGQSFTEQTEQNNPFIIDQSSFPSSNDFNQQSNRFPQNENQNIRPVYEQYNEIVHVTPSPYLSPFFDNHLAPEESSKKNIFAHPETTTDWPRSSPSPTTTPHPPVSHQYHRESIKMLAGGSHISGDATRQRIKMPPRKLKQKYKPTNRSTSTTTIRARDQDIDKGTQSQRYPTTYSDRFFDATPTPESQAPPLVTVRYDGSSTYTHSKPKPASQTTTTKFGFPTHPKPKPSTPAKFDFPTHSKLKPITTVKIDIPTHARPKSISSVEPKLEAAQSKIEPVTAKFDTTRHTVHPPTTLVSEKKPRPTTTFRTSAASSTGTKPTKKLSRGTIKFGASKPL